ncbi:hypothetical protein QJS10_CPB18g01089 [Acorus calamus]|uniref:Galactose oxidase n=1 Tax=Acorus calamus TaxID=4465 RepID=A0AAV9CKN1_ACOCL|nr:hypothetical protein QJS10_CPB18g01089 [Acorus calamus]
MRTQTTLSFLLLLPLHLLLSTVSEADVLPDPFQSSDGGLSKRPEFETDYKGGWELVSENSGVSAMHLVIFNNNKAIMFDATVFGPSQIKLPAEVGCRNDPTMKGTNKEDCWAHAVEFDIDTAEIRPLKVSTDTWCSSGAVSANGTLVQTGGWNDGGKGVRYLTPCPTCDWLEYTTALSAQRWYATQQILPDGSFIVIGGRRQFSYEHVPKPGQSNPTSFRLPFLRETTDEVENNLYPFVHLSTDGNLFVFANNRSILLDPRTNSVVKEFPVLPGGSRNYPASAMSVLLPIKLNRGRRRSASKPIPAQVLICGGASSISAKFAANGTYLPAVSNCGRLTITDPDSNWIMEQMPFPRVMGDMLNLPTGDILMLNGASRGTSGWNFAREPSLTPVLYNPRKPRKQRFTVLAPTTIPRMYHSTAAVLPDGKILVAGSNTNTAYNFTGVRYPTELRVEKFWPPYLDHFLDQHRPQIVPGLFTGLVSEVQYGQDFQVQFSLPELGLVDGGDVMVTMYAPPFTTHGYSMNQRLLVLRTMDFSLITPMMYQITAVAPPTGVVAPPGYYLVFVVHRGVPSKGIWVRIQQQ